MHKPLKKKKLMKTIKQTLFLVTASFITTASFAQLGVGVTNSTQASVSKTVNAASTTNAAANAATKAVTKATTATTGATKAAVSTGATKAAEVKGTGTTVSQVAVKKAGDTKEDAKNATDVKAGARVNAQASEHASEEAKTHANENSAIFGAKSDGSVQTSGGADVHVNGKQAIDRTEDGAEKVKVKTENRASGDVQKAKQVKDGAKAKVKTEGRAKSQGAVHASGEAKDHAADQSAVITTENQSSSDTKVSGNSKSVSASSQNQSKTKIKASKKG
jgi:hypothetical protein